MSGLPTTQDLVTAKLRQRMHTAGVLTKKTASLTLPTFPRVRSYSREHHVNTKQAKDFLVEQIAEQSALEQIPLSDIEKRMMYFTESDSVSCDNPLELNDQFEAQYDTSEYEIKISRLLQHAYKRLKNGEPQNKRTWDDAIRTLRKGDHYLLVLWDIKLPSENRIRDFLALLGTGLFLAIALGLSIFWAVVHNVDETRFRNYLVAVFILFILIASGTLRTIYRISVVWFHRRRTERGDTE